MKGLALPIVALFAAMLAGLLAGPTQPTAAPFEIESVEIVPPTTPSEPTGPGFTPKSSGCNCEGCLTDGDVRRIVGEELAKRPTAVSVPVRGETIISERVISSTPVVSQPRVIYSQPVRSGVCRIVNGVRVCN